MASQLFWFAATVDIALSIAFAVLVGRVPTPRLTPDHFSLSSSQRKDNGLACALVWLIIFSGSSALAQPLRLGGTLVLAWLVQRTAQRLRLLRRSA